ncbi:hypothetical protein ACLOJK_005431 [Asimina triloba]
MSLSVCPQIRLLPYSSRRFPRRRLLGTAARASAGSVPGKNAAAIVWFKHDLRIDDHPGLVAAVSQHRTVVPLYVFDRRIVSRFSDEMLEMVLFALEDLRRLLKDQGSDLLVGFGSAEDVLLKLMEESLKELPESHREFLKLKIPVTPLLGTPVLPRLDIALDRGMLLTFALLQKEQNNQDKIPSNPVERYDKSDSGKNIDTSSTSRSTLRKVIVNSAFISREGTLVGGGAGAVLNALAAYLRYLEGTARDDWQEVHEKLRSAESRNGASFHALFGSALSLGIISRRRVLYEAIKYEKERNAGFLSPFGYSAATVAAAVDGVKSMEYTVAGHEGPAILLVHGFGAFLEHYRDNIHEIAGSGNRVWAITLLGFGKSEKPNIVYTELVWAELLRDFIIEVVGEPATVAGNSIGGYFVALVAGFWPSLVKSVVLINTAGSVIPGYSSVQLPAASQTSGTKWLGSRFLLLYLRFRAGNILKNCYPVNTDRVDEFLVGEILRASYDPGVLVVLESIFNFNLSIPLNYLFDSFGGKVLIVQGTKDPLTKSKIRLSMLKEHCSGIAIRELDAGHCPHDELPHQVNSIIQEWIVTAESSMRPVETI